MHKWPDWDIPVLHTRLIEARRGPSVRLNNSIGAAELRYQRAVGPLRAAIYRARHKFLEAVDAANRQFDIEVGPVADEYLKALKEKSR